MGAVLQGAVLAGFTSYVGGVLADQVNLGAAAEHLNLSDKPLAFGFDRLKPAVLLDNIGDRVVSTAAGNIINGRDIFDGFDDLGRSIVFSETMALAHFGIGNLGIGNASWAGSVPHMLLHGGVGCVYSASINGNCGGGLPVA